MGQKGTLELVIGDGPARDGVVFRGDHPWLDARLASLYDAFEFSEDVPFYLELAAAQGNRVLEVACGSGRLLLPLTQAGYQVVGIDASPHMLDIARSKLDRAGVRADVVQADMRAFTLAQADFDLAIVAVKSLAYLLSPSDQLACLAAIHAHLRPGGVLAIDLMHPRPEWIAAPRGSMRDDLLQNVAAQGFTLSRVESVVNTDLAQQLRVIRSIYEVIDDSGVIVEKRFVEWTYRWMHRFEAEHLFERAGFSVEGVYGGYRREPFSSESPLMLFVGRKRS